MSAMPRQFSHVPNFTGYMARVAELVSDIQRPGLAILDMPAGNGLLAGHLREQGHTVTCGDINSERPDYVYVNMEQPLPFADSSFDVVICLEGIEHIVEPFRLVGEICRILKPGGIVILSLPNVQSFFSRLQFLFTGTFYQFEPEGHQHPAGRLLDRGHISPLSLVQLEYQFGEFGLVLRTVAGDRVKKKILLPLYGALWAVNAVALWARRRRSERADVRRVYEFLMHPRALLSRSLITVWGNAARDAR